MNVAEYGQGLREMGQKNLEALADIERERQKLGWAQKALESKSKAEGLGMMVGGIAGGLKGDYESQKRQVESDQQATQRAWQDQNQAQRIDNLVNRRAANYGLVGVPDRLEFKPYTPWQHLDDMVDHFRNLSFL